jgi:hypothetical protein
MSITGIRSAKNGNVIVADRFSARYTKPYMVNFRAISIESLLLLFVFLVMKNADVTNGIMAVSVRIPIMICQHIQVGTLNKN